jgi:hypothetical protein
MKTNYLVSGILISLFTLIIFLNNQVEVKGSSDPSQTAFSQKRQGFSLYNNTDYGFQILFPNDWTAIEGDNKPGDYATNIVFFEPLGEKGKHYSKKYPCGEVCVGIVLYSSLAGDTTLQQFSDDNYNALKGTGRSFKLLEYKTEAESKLGDKKAFELAWEEKQGKRGYTQKQIGVPYPNLDAYESKTFLILQSKIRDKYSNEMFPLTKTMMDSFRFIGKNG